MRQSFVYAKNRPSPSNENDYIAAYLRVFPYANHPDSYDVSAVITRDGIQGHALMNESDNRSKDGDYHLCKDFISDDELRYYL